MKRALGAEDDRPNLDAVDDTPCLPTSNAHLRRIENRLASVPVLLDVITAQR